MPTLHRTGKLLEIKDLHCGQREFTMTFLDNFEQTIVLGIRRWNGKNRILQANRRWLPTTAIRQPWPSFCQTILQLQQQLRRHIVTPFAGRKKY